MLGLLITDVCKIELTQISKIMHKELKVFVFNQKRYQSFFFSVSCIVRPVPPAVNVLSKNISHEGSFSSAYYDYSVITCLLWH